MRRSLLVMLLAGIAAVSFGDSVSAHPHVFIDYVLTVSFNDDAPQAVRMSWTFDEMYSSMLFHDYTSRPRDALTPADVRSLRKHAFDDTADYHYFVDLKLNGKPLEVKDVTDFNAQFKNHRMTYSFTVPVRAAAHDRTPTVMAPAGVEP